LPVDDENDKIRHKIDSPPARYRIHEGNDWLGETVARLRSEGVDVRADFQRQRSNYG